MSNTGRVHPWLIAWPLFVRDFGKGRDPAITWPRRRMRRVAVLQLDAIVNIGSPMQIVWDGNVEHIELTWYAVAKLAGIPNSGTVRDIESGRDTKLSNLEAVARALGLQSELVENSDANER